MDEIPWWDFSVYITDVVHMIHDTSGFSYATSIAAVTVVGRLVLVPIAIWHLRNNPWEAHMLEIKRLYDRANDPRAKARYKAEIESIQRQFPKRNRVALPVASLGTTLFMWIGLRRMSDLYPAEMTTGGVGWFMDLTQPDPYLFLPILSNFLMFSAHEVGADETGRPRQDFNNRLVKYSFAVIKAGLFCMWFFLPSSILCFWIPHSAISLVQTVVFSQPAVIQKLGFGHGGGGGGRTTSSVLKSTEQVRFYNQAEENVTINQDKNPHRTSPSYIRIKKKNKKASRR